MASLDYIEIKGTVSNAIAQVYQNHSDELNDILSKGLCHKINLSEVKNKIIELVFSVDNLKKDTEGSKKFKVTILRAKNIYDIIRYLNNYMAKAGNGGDSVYNFYN